MSKKVLTKYQLVTAGSLGANLTSDTVNISFADNVAIHAIFTGSPVGTFAIQGSIDGVTYANIVTAAAGGSADNIMFNINQAPYTLIRLTYTRTSGTGSVDVFVSYKEI